MSDWKKYTKINYSMLITQLLRKAKKRKDINISTYGRVNYKIKGKSKKYIFYKITSKNPKPVEFRKFRGREKFKRIFPRKFKKQVLITAGIHGEEQAGPLSILDYFDKIINYAHKNNIGIIIYPCTNPSGFDQRTRYNIRKQVDKGNNFFIIYKRKDGAWTDDLGKEKKYLDWKWADDSIIKKKKLLNFILPDETKLLLKDLRKLPLKKIKGGLDLHQDYFRKENKTYAYYFGKRKCFVPITKKVAKISPLLKNTLINSGFNVKVDKKGEILSDDSLTKKDLGPFSDSYGLISRLDGTIGQLVHNYGAKYFVTVETTKNVPVKKATKINFIWIKQIINLVAKNKPIWALQPSSTFYKSFVLSPFSWY